MSIYATCWVHKFPQHGDAHADCDWVEVFGQGVPAHIGTPTPDHGYEADDPYAGFPPQAISVSEGGDGSQLRAMVVVRDGTPKKGHRYTAPLLVTAGREYA